MTSRGALFIVGLAMTARLGAAEPPIEFSGVLTNDGRTQLALTNTATGATTWVEPGTTFLGYTIARYDAEHDAIFVRKNGEEMRLSLTAPKPVANVAANAPAPAPAAAAPAGAVASAAVPPGTPAADTAQATDAVRAHLRTLAAAARRYQAEHGASTVTYADLVGPGKPIAELPSVAGESYASFSLAPGATTASVTLGNGTPVSILLPPTAAPEASTSGALVAREPRSTTAPATTANPPTPSPTTAAATPPANSPPATSPAPPAPAANAAPPADSPYATSEPGLVATGRTAPSATYTTGVGDSWESVSARTGVPVPKLKELNSPIPSGSSLPQGQTIRLR